MIVYQFEKLKLCLDLGFVVEFVDGKKKEGESGKIK